VLALSEVLARILELVARDGRSLVHTEPRFASTENGYLPSPKMNDTIRRPAERA
jgi:hypothetical protein